MLNKITKAICSKYSSSLTMATLLMAYASQAAAQEQESTKKDEAEVEKISVVGSQIRGGQVSEALAVSVFSAEDIAELGIDSGDELLDMIPENGQNFLMKLPTSVVGSTLPVVTSVPITCVI
ncbi:hypothetical protein ACFQMB_16210 [Pseudobowmanella zhangzhouensis]|uniref:hypothetical protein n=1 Tax=Pseudobowmanella zhangzhouensis TaxID=1537679 RepID=UPI003609A8ED